MLATVTLESLLKALIAVDHGFGTKKSKAGTVPPVLVTAHSRAFTLVTKLDNSVYAISARAAIDADIREEGEYFADIVSFRSAAKKLRGLKTPRGSLVEVDGMCGRLRLSVKGKASVEVPCVAVTESLSMELYSASAEISERIGSAQADIDEVPLPPKTIDSITRTLRNLRPVQLDTRLLGASCVLYRGKAAVTTGTNLDVIEVAACENLTEPVAIPRELILRAHTLHDGCEVYTSNAMLMPDTCADYLWRWTGSDSADPSAEALPYVVALLSNNPASATIEVEAADFKRAFKELSAFCETGDLVRFLPHEYGARLLRFEDDVPDLGGRPPRAMTLLPLTWPFPRAMTLPIKQVDRAIGNAPRFTLTVYDGCVSLLAEGDEVLHLICECAETFGGATEI